VKIPTPRGPVSAALLDLLVQSPGTAVAGLPELRTDAATAVDATPDVVRDDDLQLSLFCLNVLHTDGIDGVDECWEWDVDLLGVRTVVEGAFETALRERVPVPHCPAATTAAVSASLFGLAAQDTSPGLSRYVATKATEDQLSEFLILRSIYVRQEADPHTWAIPRLRGRAKAALVEIQVDEYGGGRLERMHSELFAETMRGLGLDATFGAYVDQVPAIVLASSNLMSLFGLHRRLRGAIVGHLAAYEISSSAPNRSYGNGFRRLGHGDLSGYFDEHVEADAVHEQIAARDLAGGLVEADPGTLHQVMFGAAAALAMDGWVTEQVLPAWTAGRSSLRHELTAAR
jgi:hypothetical protein